MAIDDIIKADVFFTHQKNPNQYCYNFETTVSSEPATQDLEEFATVFVAIIMPGIKAWSDESVIFNCVKTSLVVRGDPDDDSVPLPVIKNLGDAAGTRMTLDALPGQCSAVVQTLKSIDEVKPRTRGRDFITGLVETDQTDGLWTQATADLVLNRYDTVIIGTLAGVGAGRYLYGNFSPTQQAENVNKDFVSNGGLVPDPETFGDAPFSEVTLSRMQQLVRTQRLRQPEDPCLELLVDET